MTMMTMEIIGLGLKIKYR